MRAVYRQAGHRVRFDWGPTGGAAVAEGADVAVVVDVLSFTTTVCVAVERGITVLPCRWRDERAAAYAAEQDATLAVGRLEARDLGDERAVSLSPAAMARVEGVRRVVLPSPNGSTIAAGLRDLGCTVVAASLRNRTAAARWVGEHGGTVAVVAGGERWPDGSLRPCAEDLWGAGAVLAVLAEAGADLAPEAELAAAAFAVVRPRLGASLRGCAGGLELAEAGFAADVEVAAQLDASAVVPVLGPDGAFDEPWPR